MPLIAEGDEEAGRERATLKFSQCVGLLVATLAAFSIGTYLSWTSSVLPLYNRKDTLSISNQEASWISSLLPLGAIPGVVPAKMLANRFGRKRTIWATSVPLFSCWYIIAFARNKIWLFLARLVAGAACGAASVLVPMFISEIAEQSTRGLLGTVFQLQITAGILFAYATAFTDSLHVIAILCSAAPGLLLISLPFVPESSAWLVSQGRRNEAYDSLRHFGGSSRDRIETELTRLELRVAEPRAGISDLRHHRRPICIALGLMIFQQLSGVNALIFYASRIFDATGVSSPTPIMSSVIVGAVQVIAACSSIVIIERAGKKILLFISASVMATCMFTLSGYFHFQISHDLSSVFWIPLLSLAIFVAIFSLGFGPIPCMMVDELFSNNVKSVASCATAMCNWTLAFLVTRCFQNMVDLMGISSSFAAFGMTSLIGTVFVSALVPETKDRSIEEVQIELYRARNRSARESMTETRRDKVRAIETCSTAEVTSAVTDT
ncbi:facilitated trehalose transporter Tret1-like [Odontomachus brunneus]|uniref:facilitated trehalose transporter Tret1-like n=1 Tax=Odontomachus brunneus TaxID=486640 RepID=UPI0013F1C287|nr:facilitated trehalose transporter Tret1-like [Odontomachus brunneus]